jgi:hypothetical protein
MKYVCGVSELLASYCEVLYQFFCSSFVSLFRYPVNLCKSNYIFNLPYTSYVLLQSHIQYKYQIFWEVLSLERGPLSLVRIIEELLEWKK